MSLVFDAEHHVYTFKGVRVPNVTSILSPLVDLSMVPADALEKARQEGQAIHAMVDMDSQGTLDVDALPEWMHPVYKAWRKFRDHSGFVPILNEYRVYHPSFHYAGTLDLVCELPTLKGWRGVALLDVKRSLLAGPVIGMQLAAYQAALTSEKGMPPIHRRGALRLSPDGKFQLEPYADPTDLSAFLAMLTMKRWREKHGI